MNAEDLSIVTIVTGVRGGNKTLLMTGLSVEAMARAWAIKRLRELKGNDNLYPRKKVNIWTNYPVKALWKPPNHHKAVLLNPLPLDVEKIITWHPDIHDGIIFWDEIDQVADRQDWMSTVAKLLTAGIQVIRHRNLSLIASIQSINWLNSRLQWQADVIIKCRDLAFTPWGKEQRLQPGEVANTTWIDKSGIMTGYSFEETGQVYPLQFFGKRYWGNYPTHHEVDILESKRKYKLKLGVKEIRDDAEVEASQVNLDAVHKAIEYFRYNNPGEEIPSTTFNSMARQFGFVGEAGGRVAGGGYYLRTIGVKARTIKGISQYDLSEVEIPEAEAV
jgi:hypothetical protein